MRVFACRSFNAMKISVPLRISILQPQLPTTFAGMRTLFISIFLFAVVLQSAAQNTPDSLAQELGEVVVQAFEQQRRLQEVPASISYIGQRQLQRFSNTSLVPALNLEPGVRMEERSPGSYRLNIRGSSLRAPFGIRNIKVYLNDIPFTEPGGSTYLNLLSFYNIQSVEVIRGPAGSVYGAGNGGALLLKTSGATPPPTLLVEQAVGSYGLFNTHLQVSTAGEGFRQSLSYNRLSAGGYRNWTRLHREVLSWDASTRLGKRQRLNAFVLFGNLQYQTPGALTPAEFSSNPRQSRPAAGIFPAAVAAAAGVNQQSFFSGMSHQVQISTNSSNTTSVYTAFSRFTNPTIRNLERRIEPHAGARSVFRWKPAVASGSLQLAAGGEMQQGWYNIRNYINRNGTSGALQSEDEVNPLLWMLFVQASYSLPGGWNLTAGASINRNRIRITRLSTVPPPAFERTYNNEMAPRLALGKTIGNTTTIFASVARGFSPPTSAEVLPSAGIISTNLQAESGWNYEAGIRHRQQQWYFETVMFYFSLQNAIVQRRDAAGADFFVNAGSTRQLGAESQLRYEFAATPAIPQAFIRINHTWHRFQYNRYQQLTNDFSGKQLPGVPAHTLAVTADVQVAKGFYANVSYLYQDATPLNDANSFWANTFHLLQLRVGGRVKLYRNWQIEVYCAADNILNQIYSLGNDINAAGNRFFNVAPGRNFTVGCMITRRGM